MDQKQEIPENGLSVLYVAFELGNSTWKLACRRWPQDSAGHCDTEGSGTSPGCLSGELKPISAWMRQLPW